MWLLHACCRIVYQHMHAPWVCMPPPGCTLEGVDLSRVQLARETTCQQRAYTLPDGRTIRVGSERFMAPEALFNPSLLDVESPGIAEQVFQCIQVSPTA